MSTDLVRRSDVPQALPDQMELAKAIAVSGLLPRHLQGNPANVLALQYAAQAIDVPLWTAMQEGQVINGKVGWSAQMLRGLAQRAGHKVRTSVTDEQATVQVIRADDPDYTHEATFSMDDAKRAGLASGQSWSKYPRAMLVARATTAVLREACADVLAGFGYTPEELGASVDEDGRIVGQTLHPVDGVNPQTGEIIPAVATSTDPDAAPVDLTAPENHQVLVAAIDAPNAQKAERTSEPADDKWMAPDYCDNPVWIDAWQRQLAEVTSMPRIVKARNAVAERHDAGLLSEAVAVELGTQVDARAAELKAAKESS